MIGSELYDASMDRVVNIIIHEIFSPPVASRIFAYPNIAAYEIIAQKDDKYGSLTGQVNGLMPYPGWIPSGHKFTIVRSDRPSP